eukprot:UN01305
MPIQYVCVCLAYFCTVCEALFLLFFKTFLGHRQMYDFVSLVFRFCSVFLLLALYPCLSMLALSDIIHFSVASGR